MKVITNLLIVFGFCLGTVGAAGFHSPSQKLSDEAAANAPEDEPATEPNAWLMFVGGLLVLAVGGVMQRTQNRQEAEAGAGASRASEGLLREVQAVATKIAALDDEKQSLDSEAVRSRIDALLAEEYFDLTSRNEEIAKALGFTDYAKVWDGIATAERLLARTWSMATDGHLEQGLEELPKARAQIESAVRELQAL